MKKKNTILLELFQYPIEISQKEPQKIYIPDTQINDHSFS
jgi:hypothetical protein